MEKEEDAWTILELQGRSGVEEDQHVAVNQRELLRFNVFFSRTGAIFENELHSFILSFSYTVEPNSPLQYSVGISTVFSFT